MVYGTIKKEETYAFLKGGLEKCFAYIKEHKLEEMSLGRYELDGGDLYMNLQELETQPLEGRPFEAHREFLDLHYIVEGAEKIDVNFLGRMHEETYHEDRDLAVLTGKADGSVLLREGDFLICWPEDAHRPAGMEDVPRRIRKAVFKIRCGT